MERIGIYEEINKIMEDCTININIIIVVISIANIFLFDFMICMFYIIISSNFVSILFKFCMFIWTILDVLLDI